MASTRERPDAVAWRYEVRVGSEPHDDLIVEGRFAGGSDDFEVDRRATPFVHDVAYATGATGEGWVRAATNRSGGSGWSVPCGASGCRVRYRFALADAARLHDIDTAIASGDVVVAPPSTWLMRPATTTSEERFRFHVTVSPPARFAAGTRPVPMRPGVASHAGGSLDDTFEASTDAMDASSFAVFGPFHAATIESGTARVEVAIAPHALTLADAEAVAWIRSAVDAIAAYFRGFPAPRALVIVMAGGAGPTRGETLGDGGPAVLLRAGEGLTGATTRDDWVATHELLHVSLPSLSREHTWLSEGIATYVEPIVRARAGIIGPEKVWGDLVAGLPQGLPEAGDEGLDRTHTWGRTYWGGALFCLVADVTIRERTGNARSLDDVLRAAAKRGGDAETQWDIERWLDEGDGATGTRVLHELYRDMALAPRTVDLAALWSRLGVRVSGKAVSFDDGAPFAAVRRAITDRP